MNGKGLLPTRKLLLLGFVIAAALVFGGWHWGGPHQVRSGHSWSWHPGGSVQEAGWAWDTGAAASIND